MYQAKNLACVQKLQILIKKMLNISWIQHRRIILHVIVVIFVPYGTVYIIFTRADVSTTVVVTVWGCWNGANKLVLPVVPYLDIPLCRLKVIQYHCSDSYGTSLFHQKVNSGKKKRSSGSLFFCTKIENTIQYILYDE